jgi:hypothetical protein
LAILSGVRCLGIWYPNFKISHFWTYVFIVLSWIAPQSWYSIFTYRNFATRGHARKLVYSYYKEIP